jgi:hypothetical protein
VVLVGEVVEVDPDAAPFEDPCQLGGFLTGPGVAGADIEVHAERLREGDGREVLAGRVGPLPPVVGTEQVPGVEVVVGPVVAGVGDDAGEDVLVAQHEVEGAVPAGRQPAEDPALPVGDRAVVGVDVVDDVGHEVGLDARPTRDVFAFRVTAEAAVVVGHDHDERVDLVLGEEKIHRPVE